MKFENQEQFRAAIGCGKATLSRLIRRRGWPVGKAPPWNEADVATVKAWRTNMLQPDRNWRRREGEPAAVITVIKVEHIVGDDAPFNICSWLGDVLYGELTVADFQSLAAHLNFVLRAMIEAPTDEIYDGLNRMIGVWTAQRFIGKPKWWKLLPDPLPDPPAGYLKTISPLAHRQPSKGAAIQPAN